MNAHICHADHCAKAVPPKMFMCREHWYMLSKEMRDRLWELYVPGQERRKDPTIEYIEHALMCVDYVAAREGDI